MRRSIGLVITGLVITGLLVISPWLFTRQLPEDEIQVTFNGYFDNFRVVVFYPSIYLTKKISDSTSVTGRYLVDAVSAASVKSRDGVDGVTSATRRDHGGPESTPDELRHEIGLGITQRISKGTLALNTIFSTEHDYTSAALAGQFSYPLARQNTILQLGLVKSWDRVFPQTRDWTKKKDVLVLSGGITQVLSKKMIAQLEFSYTDMSGMLTDVYQVVTIIYPQLEAALHYEPNHPDQRAHSHAVLPDVVVCLQFDLDVNQTVFALADCDSTALLGPVFAQVARLQGAHAQPQIGLSTGSG